MNNFLKYPDFLLIKKAPKNEKLKMQSYFKPLMNYLFNHESISSLPLIFKEEQVLSYIEEYSASIDLFVYPYFSEEKERFISFLKDQVNEKMLPKAEVFLKKSISSCFPEFYKEFQPPSGAEIERFINQIINYPKSRECFLLNTCLIKSKLIENLIYSLFSLSNPYTVYLLESEENKSFTANMLISFIEMSLLLYPLVILWEEENNKDIPLENISQLSQQLNRRFLFLPIPLLENLLNLSNGIKAKTLIKITNIFQEKAKFPLLEDDLRGAVPSLESWFASEYNNINLDKRILKELWEGYKEWKE